jgi:hypothetical protein
MQVPPLTILEPTEGERLAAWFPSLDAVVGLRRGSHVTMAMEQSVDPGQVEPNERWEDDTSTRPGDRPVIRRLTVRFSQPHASPTSSSSPPVPAAPPVSPSSPPIHTEEQYMDHEGPFVDPTEGQDMGQEAPFVAPIEDQETRRGDTPDPTPDSPLPHPSPLGRSSPIPQQVCNHD